MATEIIMPKLGMSMEEGKIVQWLKAEGDMVEIGEPILEVETDKVNMEVEALVAGMLLKILKNSGDVVPVTEVIGHIGEPGEKWAAEEHSLIEKTPQETQSETENGHHARVSPESRMPTDPGTRVPATPAARRLAAEKGVDLKDVQPTGRHGEIRARDVGNITTVSATPLARKIANAEGIPLSSLTGTGVGGRITKEDILKKLGSTTGTTVSSGEEPVRKKMAGMRRTIADRMLQSHLQAPPPSPST